MVNLLWTVVVIVAVFAIFGTPQFGFLPAHYGYYPTSFLGLIVIILIVILLFGRIGP